MVARNFHATGAQKRDPDPREIPVELRGSTRARIVLDRVGFHLELTYRLGWESFEEHASAVVVDRVSGEGAAMGVGDEDTPRAARDVVANNLCVHGFRAFHVNPCKTGTANIVGEDLGPGGVLFDEHASPVAYEIIPRDSGIDDFLNLDRVSEFRVASDNIVHDLGVAVAVVDIDAFADVFGAAYEMVLRDSSVDAPASADPDSGIAYETVSHNSSVASGVNVDHVHRVAPGPLILKPRKVKPETLTSLTRGPVSSPFLIFTSPRTQIASGPPVTFEQGESALALGGASITASSPRSFIPSLRIITSSR